MTRTKCPFGLQVVGRVVGQDRRVIDVVNHFTASCMECSEASTRACEQEGWGEGEQEAGWCEPEDDHFKFGDRPVGTVIHRVGVLKFESPPFPPGLGDGNATDVEAMVVLCVVPGECVVSDVIVAGRSPPPTSEPAHARTAERGPTAHLPHTPRPADAVCWPSAGRNCCR